MDLSDYREMLDEIDKQLISLFQERMSISEKIAVYKYNNGINVFDGDREREVLASRKKLADEKYANFVEPLFVEIMRLGKELQKNIITEIDGGKDK